MEKITRDSKGRLLRNGKLMSDAAVEQRLRRLCTKKKNGSLKTAQEIYDRFHNLGSESRTELAQMFKESLLNKDSFSLNNFMFRSASPGF